MNTNPPRILVADDEDNIVFLLDATFRHFGFEVHTARTGREALEQFGAVRPDVAILDVMMPDLDGFEVVRRLRLDGDHTPVVFLTARDTTEDLVRGLSVGGDVYVRKPFSVEEVLAQVQALLRRAGHAAPASVLAIGDLEMDDDAHLVRKAGELVELSPTEYNLLRFLLLNAGRVVSRAQILDHVWQYDFDGNANVVETYVSYLRRKLSAGRPLLKTVRGVGYTLRVD